MNILSITAFVSKKIHSVVHYFLSFFENQILKLDSDNINFKNLSVKKSQPYCRQFKKHLLGYYSFLNEQYYPKKIKKKFSKGAMSSMSKEAIDDVVEKHNLYKTHRLNDRLYLHCKGFQSIQNLESFTGLQVLWLETNAIQRIENLMNQNDLRSLYMQQNCINKIENLENNIMLDTLDLSHNFINKIENLSHLKHLTRLILSHNNLETAKSIEHIVHLPKLHTLDIKSNKIEGENDSEELIDILKRCKELRVLYLKGNGVVKRIPHYRKTMISICPQMNYLDDRPVFDDERRRANAFAKILQNDGTYEEAQAAERKEINLIKQEKKELEERNWRSFGKVFHNGKNKRNEVTTSIDDSMGKEFREKGDENKHFQSASTPTNDENILNKKEQGVKNDHDGSFLPCIENNHTPLLSSTSFLKERNQHISNDNIAELSESSTTKN